MSNKNSPHSVKVSQIRAYNKIKLARLKLMEETSKLEADKEQALATALNKLASKYEKRFRAMNTRRIRLAKEMENLLNTVYNRDPDLASEMAVGKEIHITPTLIQPEPTSDESTRSE